MNKAHQKLLLVLCHSPPSANSALNLGERYHLWRRRRGLARCLSDLPPCSSCALDEAMEAHLDGRARRIAQSLSRVADVGIGRGHVARRHLDHRAIGLQRAEACDEAAQDANRRGRGRRALTPSSDSSTCATRAPTVGTATHRTLSPPPPLRSRQSGRGSRRERSVAGKRRLRLAPQ